MKRGTLGVGKDSAPTGAMGIILGVSLISEAVG